MCSLQAANHQVRANAVALLMDAFPLQNPDSTNEEIDALLQQQFDILQVKYSYTFPILWQSKNNL